MRLVQEGPIHHVGPSPNRVRALGLVNGVGGGGSPCHVLHVRYGVRSTRVGEGEKQDDFWIANCGSVEVCLAVLIVVRTIKSIEVPPHMVPTFFGGQKACQFGNVALLFICKQVLVSLAGMKRKGIVDNRHLEKGAELLDHVVESTCVVFVIEVMHWNAQALGNFDGHVVPMNPPKDFGIARDIGEAVFGSRGKGEEPLRVALLFIEPINVGTPSLQAFSRVAPHGIGELVIDDSRRLSQLDAQVHARVQIIKG